MFSSFGIFLRRYPYGALLPCLSPLAAALAATAVFIGTGDDLTRFYTELRPTMPLLTQSMQFITDQGNTAFYLLYAGMAIWGIRKKDAGLVRLAFAYLAAQLAISFLLVRLLKIGVGRPRPLAALEGAGYSPFSFKGSQHSFPSGHTADAFTGAASFLARRRGFFISLGLGLYSGLIAYSRIYLSRHHLSDVFAGMVAGCVGGLLATYFCTRGKQ